MGRGASHSRSGTRSPRAQEIGRNEGGEGRLMESAREGYERALRAEPHLRVVVAVVDALCTLVRPTDRLCYGCTWDDIVKPLVMPLLGWGRGRVPEEVPDGPVKDVFREDELPEPVRTSATTVTEQ